MSAPRLLHSWEAVKRLAHDTTWRMAVPGGWIYRHTFPTNESDGYGQTMVFVPLPPNDKP